MKIKHALIENFKGIKRLEIDFTYPWDPEPRVLTCLIGDNGSGKTTVLQALALPLSMATLKTWHPADFDWRGCLPERVSSLGPTRVELLVWLDEEEVRLAAELHQEWRSLPNPGPLFERIRTPPSTHREVVIVTNPGT
jgi:predicted ATP-dependent endonuclease of OLD family